MCVCVLLCDRYVRVCVQLTLCAFCPNYYYHLLIIFTCTRCCYLLSLLSFIFAPSNLLLSWTFFFSQKLLFTDLFTFYLFFTLYSFSSPPLSRPPWPLPPPPLPPDHVCHPTTTTTTTTSITSITTHHHLWIVFISDDLSYCTLNPLPITVPYLKWPLTSSLLFLSILFFPPNKNCPDIESQFD